MSRATGVPSGRPFAVHCARRGPSPVPTRSLDTCGGNRPLSAFRPTNGVVVELVCALCAGCGPKAGLTTRSLRYALRRATSGGSASRAPCRRALAPNSTPVHGDRGVGVGCRGDIFGKELSVVWLCDRAASCPDRPGYIGMNVSVRANRASGEEERGGVSRAEVAFRGGAMHGP